ncbi:MAG: transporter [Lachnospiraceae bacterium]|nr:transporter [Lachnospiraceae bacterium]
MQKMEKLKIILKLQAVVVVYTFASIFSKLASGEQFLSVRFIIFLGLEFVVLFFYALLWQQVIKKTELSVAYANREMYLLWSLLWAVVFFHNEITVANVIGCLLVIVGTFVITGEGEES